MSPRRELCVHWCDCTATRLCDAGCAMTACKRCASSQCTTICPEWEERTCELLDRDPFVCGQCKRKRRANYLIVTSETDWEDARILDAYRELWRIEGSSKVTKTGEHSSRPVLVWTPEHIRAHFLTCYLALLIVRHSQRVLPSHPSAKALLDCSYADDGWWLFDHRIDLTDEILALVGEEAPRKWMLTRDIKALFKKGKAIRWG